MNRATFAIAGFVAGVLLCAALYLYDKASTPLDSVLAPPSPVLAKEETKKLECKPVVVYRDRVKEKLTLPDAARRDDAKHVTAAAEIPGDEHPRTVTALYDERLGTTELYVRQEPLPWLAWVAKRELGVAYGFKDDADGAVARVHGRMDFLQVKAARLGVLGNVDSDGDWYAGIGLAVRW